MFSNMDKFTNMLWYYNIRLLTVIELFNFFLVKELTKRAYYEAFFVEYYTRNYNHNSGWWKYTTCVLLQWEQFQDFKKCAGIRTLHLSDFMTQ